MVALIFNVFGLLGLCEAYIFPGFPESNTCISDMEALSCICKNRENISMTASVNFDISVIQVSGCGVVNMPFGAIPHLQLGKIIFSDIIRLNIQPFAFVGAQTLHTLQIEDVRYFYVRTHGFVGLSNVSNVTMRNISSMSLEEGAFGGISDVANFLIENSNIGDIKNSAFIMTNITLFQVIDSNIDYMESNSFLIHNAKTVLFQNCSIQEARNHSLSMSYVDSVTFSHCNFDILGTNSVHLKFSESFHFEYCTVSELNIDAFTLLDLNKGITFTHNVINFGFYYPLHFERENSSENSSVQSSADESISVFVCCNSFLCNCDIYWMWISEEPFYDINTSYCIGTHTSLSDMTPILDSHGNCMTLEENKVGSAQPISAGTLFQIPLMCLTILCGLILLMLSS